MVALDVSAGVWTRRARVTLDMRLCTAADIWRLVDPGSIDLLSPRRAHAVIGLDQRRRVLLSLRPEIDGRVLDGPGHWAIYEAPERANAMLFNALSVVP
jgi:hypothetical protein